MASAGDVQSLPDHRASVISKHRLAPPACATAEPRAPGGMKIHAAGSVRAMLRIADARASAIREIDAQHVDQWSNRRACRRSGLVPLRAPPASKHHNARECVRQRAPGLGVGITGCFGTKRRWKESVQECLHGRERAWCCQRIGQRIGQHSGRWKRNAPGGHPRAFAFLGDRGTDLPEGGSVRCEADVESCRAIPGKAQTVFATIARHRLVLLVVGGVHSAGCRRDVEGMHRSRAAMGAHFTRVFFRMQTLFLHPATNGLHRPAHAVTRKRRSGRSRFVG